MPGLCAVLHAPPIPRRIDWRSWPGGCSLCLVSPERACRRPRRASGWGPSPSKSHPDAVAASPDGRWRLAIDGELYAAAAERARLRAAGVAVDDDTDAALLLAGWRHEGTAFLVRLHGSFSALVFDRETRELVVLTDRFGQRPIYVTRAGDRLVVASEIKALLADPDVSRARSNAGLGQFFAFGHFFNDDTFYTAIRAVPGATAITYRAPDLTPVETTYWKPSPASSTSSDADLVRALDDHLAAAMARRARPGERLGLSLSGGLDARTLLGLLPTGVPLTSVSIGIEGSIDHRGATELSRIAGVKHHNYLLGPGFLAHFEEHLRTMVRLTDGHYLDQGIVMPSMMTYRDLGIDYLLRGHGGELLHMTKAYAYSLDERVVGFSDADLEAWLLSASDGVHARGCALRSVRHRRA